MMKPVLLALMLSASSFALYGTAMAQTSTDTQQTDQSEEDWRKSQKKSDSSDDILDIIKNTRSSGVGNGRGYSPIDALPEESRRHLMKERAKRMAQAGPNEPVDVSYTPSEAAKSDPNLEDDEQAAWSEMSKSMNGSAGSAQTPQDQAGQGASQDPSQGTGQSSGQDPSQAQGGPQSSGSSDASGDQGSPSSVMRGGSSASVADIMAQIKGMGKAPSAQTQNADGQQSQTQQADGSSSQQADASAQAAQAQADAQAAQTQSQQATRTPEPMSPLYRLQQSNQEQSSSGNRSSASDYLKKSN